MRLGVPEIARLFEVSERTVQRWIAEDHLPSHEVEGDHRFHRAEVLEWATARDLTPAPEFFETFGASDVRVLESSLADALERGGVHLVDTAAPAGSTAASAPALAALLATLPLPEPERALIGAVLAARPNLGLTEHGDGLALPHVRHPIVTDLPHPLLVVCFLTHPTPFDGPPLHTVLLLATPTVRDHLVLLSRLVHALHVPAVRAALARRAPCDDLVQALRALEAPAGDLPRATREVAPADRGV